MSRSTLQTRNSQSRAAPGPGRKETRWSRSGCLVYAVFLTATVFYYYVRIRHTLHSGPLWYSVLALVFELLATSSVAIHGLCLLRVRLPRKSTHPVPAQPYVVRVLVPCYTESVKLVAHTILAAANAELPPAACRTVYLLDDGNDSAKAAWVTEQGRGDIIYVGGRVRDKGETNGKACNLNNTLRQLYPRDKSVDEMELVVIFDADMVCYKDFFVKILAELDDPQVAIVQSPQKFHNYDDQCDIFNHSNLSFWQVLLPGLDGWDIVSCTGTNFIIRARAAQEAGWFPTYTLVEDMALAQEVQKQGWKGVYVQEHLAIGEAPETIRNTFMQKSRWCKGRMQLFFSKHNAAFASNLSIMQRIVWNIPAWSCLCTTLTVPVFLVIPVVAIWTGHFPLQFNWWFALGFTIYIPCRQVLLCSCRSASQMRCACLPLGDEHMFWYAYAKATFKAVTSRLLNREIKFKTTEKSVMAATITDLANKAKQQTSPIRHAWSLVQDVWIHFLVLMVCCVSVAAGIAQLVETFQRHSGQSISLLVSIGWVLYNMATPLLLLSRSILDKRSLRIMCSLITVSTSAVLCGIIVTIWMVVPHAYGSKQMLLHSLPSYYAQKSGSFSPDSPVLWRGNPVPTDIAPIGQSLAGITTLREVL